MSRSNAELEHALREAAELEHCLLNTYLFAACSLKSHPGEFGQLADGTDNLRRAIQFERVREWKKAIIEVAREEMLHLHYVQCMLRALGASPHMALPPRTAAGNGWHFSGWSVLPRDPSHPDSGTDVPLEQFGLAAVRRFVMYESTESLREAGPLSEEVQKLFGRLAAVERRIRVELALHTMVDDADRGAIRKAVLNAIETLPARHPSVAFENIVHFMQSARPDAESQAVVRFESVGDLYAKIKEMYAAAAAAGRVPYANEDLNGELLSGDAKEAMLPVGPVKRDRNFEQDEESRQRADYRNFASVRSVVESIVEEGEGNHEFLTAARGLADDFSSEAATRDFVDELRRNQNRALDDDPVGDLFANRERLRNAHLYRFAVISADLDNELALAASGGDDFRPTRAPAECSKEIQSISADIPLHFNAAYVALLAWLSRIYERTTWETDKRRRVGIEMLAAWPLMTMAIQPCLELAGFFDLDASSFFKYDTDGLPDGSPAVELARTMLEDRRNDVLNHRMDELGLQALTQLAVWAQRFRAMLRSDSSGLDELTYHQIDARLASLARLGEFEKQFSFREKGGYSGTPLDHHRVTKSDLEYEEDPSHTDFGEGPVLRLRFAGRGLVQLATDPDPPTDESGVSGTHMLHASDLRPSGKGSVQADAGRQWGLDRSLVWQPDARRDLVREPLAGSSSLGVRVVAAELVQLSEGPGEPLVLAGLSEAELGNLRLDLMPRGAEKPYLFGDNHLAWTDGEPIDPFDLTITRRPNGSASSEVLRRSVYDDGQPMTAMTPQQRALSGRGPIAFGGLANIPSWARSTLSDDERLTLEDEDFSAKYLSRRADFLGVRLSDTVREASAAGWTRERMDDAISLLERSRRVVSPPRTTTPGWLNLDVAYRHSLSGRGHSDGLYLLLDVMRPSLEEPLRGRATGRAAAQRWVVQYSLGVMDTDVLSNFVHGELFIPLEPK